MEETVEMETKLCDNCKKDVPVRNYLAHSIHCPRNIRLCPHCNEPYPIIEMDTHIDQDHAEVVCPDCYEFMEAADLPSHKANSCPKRLISCIICEVDLPSCEMMDHLDYCGSRSDRCDGCGKLVLLKHQPFHLSTRHALVKPETDAEQAQCMEQFLNQYKKVTSRVQHDSRPITNTSKLTATNGASSRVKPPSGCTDNSLSTTASSSSAIRSSNGITTGSQIHQSSNSTYLRSSTTSNSTSNSATKLVSPLKSASQSVQPATTSPSSSYLSSLPAPSTSVVALLEPLFSAPSMSMPPNNPTVPSLSTPSNGQHSQSDPSVATLRNVDNAIQECVDSISAGLRVRSDVSKTGTISSLNALRSQSSTNKSGDSNRSSSDTHLSAISNGITPLAPSVLSRSKPNSASITPASSRFKQQDAVSSVNNGTNTVGASNHVVRPYPANSPHYGEEGAASLESQFQSRPQGPRVEVLRPNGSEPSDKMRPVNRPPLQTRRRNYQDDVLTDYMHLLEEQGLSGGIQASSQNKATRSMNSSRPSNLPDTNQYNGFDLDNGYTGFGARGLREHNGRQHIAPRETVRERADRIRRDREREELTALTRTTELRGLNQVLSQGRNVVNQAMDEEAALCLPCEFCDAPIPMDHLIVHQTGCRPDLIYH